MGIQKLAVVIEHSAAGGRAAGESEAARHGVHRRIDAGEEGSHSGFDVVGLAEGPHNAALGQRVTLLGGRPGQRGSPRQCGPGGDIPPVRICSQQPIHGQQRAILIVVDILAVLTAAGPVHEPHGLKGSLVRQLHTDYIGHLAGEGLIFIRRAGTVQGEDDPEPGRRRHVLAGGVDTVPAAKTFQPLQHRVCAACGDVVQIQRNEVTPGYSIGLPAGPRQRSAYEAALVLQVILLSLRQGHVFRECFPAARREAQTGIELRQHHSLREPLGGPSAGSRGDCDPPIVLHCHIDSLLKADLLGRVSLARLIRAYCGLSPAAGRYVRLRWRWCQ